MFYILNFADHSFQTCNNAVETKIAIDVITRTGTDMGDLEIINGRIEDGRMSVVEFWNQFWEE